MRNITRRSRARRHLIGIAIFALGPVALARPLLAHCDTLDGPVVSSARTALARGEVTPVLQWIAPEHEAEVRGAFERALTVRVEGAAARKLADEWFFETVVRLHRAGEGFPYAGLRPAGTPIDPLVEAADLALETGSVDALEMHLAAAVAEGLHERFRLALEAKRHADESVEAGRRFVAAYVEFTHYAEAVGALVAGGDLAHQGETGPGHE